MLNNSIFHTIPEGLYQFRPVGDHSLWCCVNSKDFEDVLLSSFLRLIDIQVDDDCQFCRVIRYLGNTRTTLIYRFYVTQFIEIQISRDSVL